MADQSRQCRSARLTEHQRRCRIDVDEHLFHRRLLRLVNGNDFADMPHNHGNPVCQRLIGRRFDAAGGDVKMIAPPDIDDAETRYAAARVDAQDTDGCRHIHSKPC